MKPIAPRRMIIMAANAPPIAPATLEPFLPEAADVVPSSPEN